MRLRRGGERGRTSTVAIAGAGYAAVVHALAAKGVGMTVRAVASAGGRSARHLAGELDARRVQIEELPAGADVLVVATPPDTHVDLAIQGLRRGASVLVEKPLATTLAAADRLLDEAAARPERRIRCAENLLHAPVLRAALDRRPALGSLTHLSLRAVQPEPTWGHFTQPLTAGGVLFDLGPHPLAVALALAAEDPVAVSATLTSVRSDGADDHAEVSLRFPSGLVASCEVSWRDEQVCWDAQASSDTGVLRLELLPEVLLEADGDPVHLAARRRVDDPRLEQLGYADQLVDLVSADGPGQTIAEARTILEIICAAYASAGSEGAEVPLPFTGDRSATPLRLWRG